MPAPGHYRNMEITKNLVCQNYEDEKLSLTLYTGDSETSTLANIEEPDEMPHKVVFHQGLLCLQRQKTIFRERNTLYLEIITSDPSIHTMDHTKFILSNQKEESISSKGLNQLLAVIMIKNMPI